MKFEVDPELPRTTVGDKLIVCGTMALGPPCWKRRDEYVCQECHLILMLKEAHERIEELEDLLYPPRDESDRAWDEWYERRDKVLGR